MAEHQVSPSASIFDGLNLDTTTEVVQRIPGANATQPTIECGTTIVSQSEDGRIVTGLWRCEPCDWAPMDTAGRGEFFQVLQGSIVIRERGGEPVEVSPGQSVYTPPGWSGLWRVSAQLKKAFITFNAGPGR